MPSAVVSGSSTAIAWSTMTLGRPVLPPLAIALTCFEIRSGNGADESAGSYKACSSTTAAPAARAAAPPTITFGSSSARMACSSSGGSRCDTGAGVAPSAQQANATSSIAGLFGSAIATKSPSVTPTRCSARALRFTRAASSARVSVTSSQDRAGRSGSRAACRFSSPPIDAGCFAAAGVKPRPVAPPEPEFALASVPDVVAGGSVTTFHHAP